MLREHHKIFVLVRNGFDIAIMNQYKKKREIAYSTGYEDFYNYIIKNSLTDTESNLLFSKMVEDRKAKKDNWSDFENTLDELLKEGGIPCNKLEQCIEEFQEYFARFLYDLITPKILMDVNHKARKNKLAMQSLGKFLMDIADNIKFAENTEH